MIWILRKGGREDADSGWLWRETIRVSSLILMHHSNIYSHQKQNHTLENWAEWQNNHQGNYYEHISSDQFTFWPWLNSSKSNYDTSAGGGGAGNQPTCPANTSLRGMSSWQEAEGIWSCEVPGLWMKVLVPSLISFTIILLTFKERHTHLYLNWDGM